MREVAKAVFYSGSRTFNLGQIGSWQTVLEPGVRKLLQSELRVAVAAMGYEAES